MAAGGNEQWEQRFPQEAKCNRCDDVYLSSYVVLCKCHCLCHRCYMADQNAINACPHCAETELSSVIVTQATPDLPILQQWETQHNSGLQLRSILIVASVWGNSMDIGYTWVRDLVERYSKWKESRIFCICSGCSDADKNNANHSGFVLLPINDLDDDSVEQLQNTVGRVDVLIGLVPGTLERILDIKNALLEPPGKIIMLAHNKVENWFNRIQQLGPDVIYSLGSFIYRCNQSALVGFDHYMYIPQLNPNFTLSVRNTPAAHIFLITFPQIFDRIDDQLFRTTGFDTALLVCERFRLKHASADQKVELQIFVTQNAANLTAELTTYIRQFTQIQFFEYTVNDEHAWKDALVRSSVCLCPYRAKFMSRGLDFQHWIYTLIDINVPYLVSSQSPIGSVVSEALGRDGPSPVIQWTTDNQNYVDNWVRALSRAFQNTDAEKIRHALWKKMMIDVYMSNGDTLYLYACGASLMTLRVIPVELKYINEKLKNHYAMVERSGSHTDLLDTVINLIISKCESGSQITETDFKAEVKMIDAYKKIRDAGAILVSYDTGSIVLTVIPLDSKFNLQDTEIAKILENTLIPQGILDEDTTHSTDTMDLIPTSTSKVTSENPIFGVTKEDMPVGPTRISTRREEPSRRNRTTQTSDITREEAMYQTAQGVLTIMMGGERLKGSEYKEQRFQGESEAKIIGEHQETDINPVISSLIEIVRQPDTSQHYWEEAIANSNLYIKPVNTVTSELSDKSHMKPMEGSIVWPNTLFEACIADRCSSVIKLVNVSTNKERKYFPASEHDVYGILSGVSVKGERDKHLDEHVIVVRSHDKTHKAVHIYLNKTNWRILSTLHVDDPLMLCPIYNNAVAVLSAKRGSNSATIRMFGCSDIDCNSDITVRPRKILEVFSSQEPQTFCFGIRDLICYSDYKFYLCCFMTSTVHLVDMHGYITHVIGGPATAPGLETPGLFYKPCGLFTVGNGEEEYIIITCFDGYQQANIKHKNDGTWETQWSEGVKSLDKVHGMWYNNEVLLTIADHGLDYTSIPLAPKLQTQPTSTIKPNQSHNFHSHLVQTVWPTSNPDIVAVGGAESAHIFLVRSNAEVLTTQFINRQARVVSGVHVFGNTHWVVLHDDKNSYLYYIVIDVDVNMTEDDTKSTYGLVRNTNIFKPISLLTIDNDHIGVLGNEENKASLKIYYSQIEDCKYKKTMYLESIDIGINDSACIDKNGFLYVACYHRKNVYKFDLDGTCLSEMATPSVMFDLYAAEINKEAQYRCSMPRSVAEINKVAQSRSSMPCSVMIDEMNDLLVQCVGRFYRNENRKSTGPVWKVIMEQPTWDICCSGMIIYAVYLHTLRIYNTDYLIHGKIEEEKTRIPASKNPPLVQTVDCRAIKLGDVQCKYSYPAVHLTSSLESMSYRGPITLPDSASTCWAAEDHLIVGGKLEPTLTVVSLDGLIVQHTLSVGSSIQSGVHVEKCLNYVCVEYSNDTRTTDSRIHLVKFDHYSQSNIVLHPLATLKIYNSVQLFIFSNQLCGTLCMSKKTNLEWSNVVIHVFGLDFAVLASDTDPETKQSIAIWGRRAFLHLNILKPHPLDKVTVSANELLCIMSSLLCEIRVYSKWGRYLYTIGNRNLNPESITSPRLWFPVSVNCTADNTLVVTDMNGTVHSYSLSSDTGEIAVRGEIEDDAPVDVTHGRFSVYGPAKWSLMKKVGSLKDMREGFMENELPLLRVVREEKTGENIAEPEAYFVSAPNGWELVKREGIWDDNINIWNYEWKNITRYQDNSKRWKVVGVKAIGRKAINSVLTQSNQWVIDLEKDNILHTYNIHK